MDRPRTVLIAAIVAVVASVAGATAAEDNAQDRADVATITQATAKIRAELNAIDAAANRIGARHAAQPAPPPTEEPPAETAGKVLFNGDQIKDFPGVQRAASDRITEVPDPLGSGETVFKFTVDDSDTIISPNPRAQLESPTFVTNGLEFWWGTKVLIPANFPSFNGWLTFMSVYGPPFAGSSPWHLNSFGKTVEWEEHPWSQPLSDWKGRWVTVLWHAKFAEAGWAELWINGQQQTFTSCGCTRLNTALRNRTNSGGNNNLRISQYRQKGVIPGKATMYFGPVVAGTSRASVGG